MAEHRPPRDCPVCRRHLVVTGCGCPECGTGITGAFRMCAYCGLTDDEFEMLRVFLVSRGNMRELEKHLGVSYPTTRQRFADLLAKLGLEEPRRRAPAADRDKSSSPTSPPAASASTRPRSSSADPVRSLTVRSGTRHPTPRPAAFRRARNSAAPTPAHTEGSTA